MDDTWLVGQFETARPPRLPTHWTPCLFPCGFHNLFNPLHSTVLGAGMPVKDIVAYAACCAVPTPCQQRAPHPSAFATHPWQPIQAPSAPRITRTFKTPRFGPLGHCATHLPCIQCFADRRGTLLHLHTARVRTHQPPPHICGEHLVSLPHCWDVPTDSAGHLDPPHTRTHYTRTLPLLEPCYKRYPIHGT